jgi:hypothetical protein
MLDTHTPPSYFKHITNKAALFAAIGVVGWIILLIYTATGFEKSTLAKTTGVSVGPILLNQIRKQPVDPGYQISISFEPGLAWYGASWVLAGSVCGFVIAHRQSHDHKQIK